MRASVIRTAVSLSRCGRTQRSPFNTLARASSLYVDRRYFSDKSDETNEREITVDFVTETKENITVTSDDLDRSTFTEEVPIRMPDMGNSKAKLLKWYKNEGDIIKRNDVLCDIETTDFTFGMMTEDECDAIMGKIEVPEDSGPVDDGDLLCTIWHQKETAGEKKEE